MIRTVGVALAAGLVAAVVVANWVTVRYGFVPVGFGLTAAAGTFAAGVALALRDAVQDLLGRLAVVAVIAVGAVASFFVSTPAIAVASAVAFAVAELVDLLVYTPLRARASFGDRWWMAAVLLSGLVGAVVDTAVFIGLAFGWAAVGGAVAGQLVGKSWASLTYIAIGKAVSGGPVLRQSLRRPEGA